MIQGAKFALIGLLLMAAIPFVTLVMHLVPGKETDFGQVT